MQKVIIPYLWLRLLNVVIASYVHHNKYTGENVQWIDNIMLTLKQYKFTLSIALLKNKKQL